ncbi:MAG TPA: hypothetical protein VFW45_01085 [Candidatus Polarisedimenticolia bacterium]|nr:hypothetical protein [Candidatus Polarisedimenticolia bacterium]
METWRLSLLPSLLRWLFSLLAAFGIMMLSLEGTTAFAAPPERHDLSRRCSPISVEEWWDQHPGGP